MRRVRRVALLALAMALAPAGAARAAPAMSTDNGTPLPDPFRRALSAAPDAAVSAAYKNAVFQHLSAANHAGEKTTGVPGMATVHFTVGGDGALVRIDVTRSGGDPAFAANVVAMVRKAAPFPPPPAGVQREFDATFRFQAAPKP